jgi:hypothetical protein
VADRLAPRCRRARQPDASHGRDGSNAGSRSDPVRLRIDLEGASCSITTALRLSHGQSRTGHQPLSSSPFAARQAFVVEPHRGLVRSAEHRAIRRGPCTASASHAPMEVYRRLAERRDLVALGACYSPTKQRRMHLQRRSACQWANLTPQLKGAAVLRSADSCEEPCTSCSQDPHYGGRQQKLGCARGRKHV